MVSKLLLVLIVCLTVVKLQVDASKICYKCDEKHARPWWKFWAEKVTKCQGVPAEKYKTRTSAALGASVLTCYTKFDDAGAVIKRDAYGFGETFDKTVKCSDRYHTCCEEELCNKDTQAPCPPTPKATPQKEVKACYECKGYDACRPERLHQGAEIRTSSVLGAKNLYCFTKFDPKTGHAIARGGFGFGEIFDKSLKCDSKDYLCCYQDLCNTQTAGSCAKRRN
ncbi:unnamed protein product [Adineta steineri]|uniref:Uncharacterized protein n=1 Tax=Adineta steineri TaxID=433720 RepID=A0A819PQ13_9BILA|nr:unnamed protein product [Adineta steineri]CAF0961097.1 unnamed protein product [Adineta steineri]CAF1114266.1 unnamed protein product [Adineta steineri]CAF3635732.1 unnamed protein product [Adineta steineri]CAF4016229.1 unnamed protein product [Adineta steineri]